MPVLAPTGSWGTFEKSNDRLKAGPRAGLVLDMALTKKLSLQPGLFYSMKGSKAVDKMSFAFTGTKLIYFKGTYTTTLHYLELPVNLIFRLGRSESNSGFLVYGGPYLACAFSGQEKVTATGPQAAQISGLSRKLNIGNEKPVTGVDPQTGAYQFSPGDDLKPLDFGVQAGIGYRLPLDFILKRSTSWGLPTQTLPICIMMTRLGRR